jgi:hypothetical protein
MLATSPALAQQPLPAAPPPAAAPAARPPGTVRLGVRAYRNKGKVHLFTARAGQQPQTFVCEAPCKADVYPGTRLVVTHGDSDEGHELTMSGAPGSEVDLEVRPPSKGALAGGIVLVAIGGLTALIGGILVAVAAEGKGSDEKLMTPGLITLAAGGGLTVGGIFLLTNRTSEPRVHEYGGQGRAPLSSTGERTALAPPALTPLSWAVQF